MLSYRSKPHCGGQGVYIRHLSRELVRLGHDVEVFSGQPYPDLDEGVRLTKVPSLDLYREPDPFRVPKLREFRDRIDVEEFLTMCTAGFPEPKTFGSRISRLMRERTPITPPNSTRVNSAFAPILMDSGSRERPTSWASGAIGANTTAPAVAAATVVFRMRFVGEAPDISPDPCRTRPLIAVNRRSP